MKRKKNYFLNGIQFGLGLLIIFASIIAISAVGFHLANEILPGNFTGNFIFKDNVTIENNIILGNPSICDTNNEGSIRYNSGVEYCDGNVWKTTSTITPMGGNDAFTVLLMHFNGDREDSSMYSNTISINGDITPADSSGVFNNCMYTYGGRFTASDSDYWHFDGDFTIDYWLRMDATPTLWDYQISHWMATGNQRSWWGGLNGGGSKSYYFRLSEDGTTSNTVEVEGTTQILGGNWYHIAIVRSGTTLSLYINGQLEDQKTMSFTPFNSNADLILGGSNGGANIMEDGRMDEFRISKGIARWTTNFIPPSREYD